MGRGLFQSCQRNPCRFSAGHLNSGYHSLVQELQGRKTERRPLNRKPKWVQCDLLAGKRTWEYEKRAFIEPRLGDRKVQQYRRLLEEGEKQQKGADHPPATSAPFEEALNTRGARRRNTEGVVLGRGRVWVGFSLKQFFWQANGLDGRWDVTIPPPPPWQCLQPAALPI